MAQDTRKALDEKTKKLAGGQQIKQGQEHSAYQESQQQLLAIQAEQQQNLAVARAESKASFANNQTLAQAAELGATSAAEAEQAAMQGGAQTLNPATVAVLSKYGMGQPKFQKTQSHTQQVTKQNITINNNTTMNTTNDVKVPANIGGPVQGRPLAFKAPVAQAAASGGGSAGRFKSWIASAFARQNEEGEKRDREYRRRESSLTRSANKMMKKLEEIGKTIGTRMDPRKIGSTWQSQLKTLLFLFGFGYLASNWTKILKFVSGIEKWFKEDFSKFFGIGKYSKDTSEFKKKILRLLGADNENQTIFGALRDLFLGEKGFLGLLKQYFKDMWHERAEAVKMVKFPEITDALNNPLQALKDLFGYLGNLFTAFIEGADGIKKIKIAEATKEVNLSADQNRVRTSHTQVLSTQKIKDPETGEEREVQVELGSKAYNRENDDRSVSTHMIDQSGNLTNQFGAEASLAQGSEIRRLYENYKLGYGDATSIAVGMGRLSRYAKKEGMIPVQNRLLNEILSPEDLDELRGSNDIVWRVPYKEVLRKKTDDDYNRNISHIDDIINPELAGAAWAATNTIAAKKYGGLIGSLRSGGTHQNFYLSGKGSLKGAFITAFGGEAGDMYFVKEAGDYLREQVKENQKGEYRTEYVKELRPGDIDTGRVEYFAEISPRVIDRLSERIVSNNNNHYDYSQAVDPEDLLSYQELLTAQAENVKAGYSTERRQEINELLNTLDPDGSIRDQIGRERKQARDEAERRIAYGNAFANDHTDYAAQARRDLELRQPIPRVDETATRNATGPLFSGVTDEASRRRIGGLMAELERFDTPTLEDLARTPTHSADRKLNEYRRFEEETRSNIDWDNTNVGRAQNEWSNTFSNLAGSAMAGYNAIAGRIADNATMKYRKEYLMKAFTDKGLNRGAAAGIIGNLESEGLQSEDPGKKYRDGNKKHPNAWSVGIAGFHQYGAFPELESWSNDHGLDWRKFETQAMFLADHNVTKKIARVTSGLTPQDSIQKAAVIWGHDFERFRGHDAADDQGNIVGQGDYISVKPNKKNSFTSDGRLYGNENYTQRIQRGLNTYNAYSGSSLDNIQINYSGGRSKALIALIGDSYAVGMSRTFVSEVEKHNATGKATIGTPNLIRNRNKDIDKTAYCQSSALIQDAEHYAKNAIGDNASIIVVHVGLNNYSESRETIYNRLVSLYNVAAGGGAKVFFIASITTQTNPRLFEGENQPKKVHSTVVKFCQDNNVGLIDLEPLNSKFKKMDGEGLHPTNFPELAKEVVNLLFKGGGIAEQIVNQGGLFNEGGNSDEASDQSEPRSFLSILFDNFKSAISGFMSGFLGTSNDIGTTIRESTDRVVNAVEGIDLTTTTLETPANQLANTIEAAAKEKNMTVADYRKYYGGPKEVIDPRLYRNYEEYQSAMTTAGLSTQILPRYEFNTYRNNNEYLELKHKGTNQIISPHMFYGDQPVDFSELDDASIRNIQSLLHGENNIANLDQFAQDLYDNYGIDFSVLGKDQKASLLEKVLNQENNQWELTDEDRVRLSNNEIAPKERLKQIWRGDKGAADVSQYGYNGADLTIQNMSLLDPNRFSNFHEYQNYLRGITYDDTTLSGLPIAKDVRGFYQNRAQETIDFDNLTYQDYDRLRQIYDDYGYNLRNDENPDYRTGIEGFIQGVSDIYGQDITDRINNMSGRERVDFFNSIWGTDFEYSRKGARSLKPVKGFTPEGLDRTDYWGALEQTRAEILNPNNYNSYEEYSRAIRESGFNDTPLTYTDFVTYHDTKTIGDLENLTEDEARDLRALYDETRSATNPDQAFAQRVADLYNVDITERMRGDEQSDLAQQLGIAKTSPLAEGKYFNLDQWYLPTLRERKEYTGPEGIYQDYQALHSGNVQDFVRSPETPDRTGEKFYTPSERSQILDPRNYLSYDNYVAKMKEAGFESEILGRDQFTSYQPYKTLDLEHLGAQDKEELFRMYTESRGTEGNQDEAFINTVGTKYGADIANQVMENLKLGQVNYANQLFGDKISDTDFFRFHTGRDYEGYIEANPKKEYVETEAYGEQPEPEATVTPEYIPANASYWGSNSDVIQGWMNIGEQKHSDVVVPLRPTDELEEDVATIEPVRTTEGETSIIPNDSESEPETSIFSSFFDPEALREKPKLTTETWLEKIYNMLASVDQNTGQTLGATIASGHITGEVVDAVRQGSSAQASAMSNLAHRSQQRGVTMTPRFSHPMANNSGVLFNG